MGRWSGTAAGLDPEQSNRDHRGYPAVVPAGIGGAIAVYPSQDTDLVVDIDGYFAPPGTGGLSLYAIIPCRVLDTRTSGGGLAGAATRR